MGHRTRGTGRIVRTGGRGRGIVLGLGGGWGSVRID